MTQLLVSILPVPALAPGASLTLPHGLASNGAPVPPTLVYPDRATPIVVAIVTATTVTFTNNGSSTETAHFRCERGLSAELDASTIAPMLWQGASGSGGGGGGGAPSNAPYVTAAASALLENERVLTGSSSIDVADAGPNAPILLSLKPTGVIAGSYTSANLTVDAEGRITAASSGAGTGITRVKTSFDSGYTIEANVLAVFWNCAGGNATTFLPSPTGNDGRIINIKRTDTGSSTLTVLTVAGSVEGGASYIIAGGGGRISLSFQSDNANWWIV